jgi:pyridoxamine 5'-phosphate oxidase
MMSQELKIADLRKEYHLPHVFEKQMLQDPFLQFKRWFLFATNAHVPEVNAAMLATVDGKSQPHARVILVKDFSQEGVVFYTNYHSQKGQDLLSNPNATIVFWWQKIARQIRIEGPVKKTDAKTSDAYFASRPRDYQVGAWASEQSKEISNRKELEHIYHALQKEYADKPVPRPPHWGGFCLEPHFFEFWSGGEHRLHDRIAYQRGAAGKWKRVRLAP